MERARVAVIVAFALAAGAAGQATPTGTTTTTLPPGGQAAAPVVEPAPERLPVAPPTTTTTSPAPPLDTGWHPIAGFALDVGVLGELPPPNPWVRMAGGIQAIPSTEASLFRAMPPLGTTAPMLAAAPRPPEPVADGSRWVADVPLRPGATWSDGTPVTARDVAFSFRQANLLGLAAPAGYPPGPDGEQTLIDVSPIAPDTVRFVWSARPTPEQWPAGAAFAPVYPEHHWMPLVGTARAIDDLDPEMGYGAPTAAAYEVAAGAEATRTLRAVDGYWEGGSIVAADTSGTIRLRKPGLGVEETYGPGIEAPALASWTIGPFAARVEIRSFAGPEDALMEMAAGTLDLLVPEDGIDPNLLVFTAGNPRARPVMSPAVEPTGLEVAGNGALAAHPGLVPALSCLVDRESLFVQTGGRVIPARSTYPGGWEGWAPPPPPSCGDGDRSRLEAAVAMLSAAGWSWEAPPTWDSEGGVPVPGRRPVGPGGSAVGRVTLSAPGPVDDPVAAVAVAEVTGALDLLGIGVSTRPPGRGADLALVQVELPDDAAMAADDGFVPLYRKSIIQLAGIEVELPFTPPGGLTRFSGLLESIRPTGP